ncbi:MAG: patatin-like phospholipase family protein [Desmonostoc geniculatum HA4340-LM1]|nr:patatin-like phospholipase family protein [Desmonostoc geniculatum HA4340-LM1]
MKRKFPSEGIEDVLGRYFQETKLSEALKEVLITSYDIEKRSPYFFRRSQARAKPNLYDFPMAKVARATSAAPTYFEPLKLEVDKSSSPYHAFIDGGVFANNPAMCAYAEVKSIYPNDTDNDKFIVNSLSGKCIDVAGAPGRTNGAALQLWDCERSGRNADNGSTTDQKWELD